MLIRTMFHLPTQFATRHPVLSTPNGVRNGVPTAIGLERLENRDAGSFRHTATSSKGRPTALSRNMLDKAVGRPQATNSDQQQRINSANGTTARKTARKRETRRTSVWELARILHPLPRRRLQQRRSDIKRRPFDLKVIEFAFVHRLVEASQFQRRFPRWFSSDSTTARHLARLVDLGHLAAAATRGTGPSFPFGYVATGPGIRLVHGWYRERGIEWPVRAGEQNKNKGKAATSVLHEILCTEIDLLAELEAKRRGDLELLAVERRFFRAENRISFTHRGSGYRIVPDAGYLLAYRTPRGERKMQWLALELDNGTMDPGAAWLDKLWRYEKWLESDAHRQYLRRLSRDAGGGGCLPDVRLLLVAHDRYGQIGGDNRRAAELLVEPLTLGPVLRQRALLTTAAAIGRQGSDSLLSAPLWIRLRRAGPWLQQYRSYAAKLDDDPEMTATARTRRKHTFLRAHLPDMPRFRLLPEQDCSQEAGGLSESHVTAAVVR